MQWFRTIQVTDPKNLDSELGRLIVEKSSIRAVFRSAIFLFRIHKAVVSIRIGLDTCSGCARMISMPCFKRLETFAINHMDLRAAAKLTGKFLKRWLKIVFAKENAGQL